MRRAKAFELLNQPLKACHDYSCICVKESFAKTSNFAADAEACAAYRVDASLTAVQKSLERLLEQVGRQEAETLMVTREPFLPSISVIHNYLDSFAHDPFPAEALSVAELDTLIAADAANGELFLRRALVRKRRLFRCI